MTAGLPQTHIWPRIVINLCAQNQQTSTKQLQTGNQTWQTGISPGSRSQCYPLLTSQNCTKHHKTVHLTLFSMGEIFIILRHTFVTDRSDGIVVINNSYKKISSS